MNDPLQRYYQRMYGIAAIQIAGAILGFWVIYLFYARLSDIAKELLKLRIAYEMAEDRKARAAGVAARPPGAASGENPFATEERYKPNPGK